MYEYEKSLSGLGWSDHFVDGQAIRCEHVVGGVKKCFTTMTQDRQCAEDSNCFELTGREREQCQTVSGASGYLWCCPRDLPPPPGNPCVPQPQRFVCRQHDRRCSDFVNNADQYQTCLIQKELCNLGLDSGPINGDSGSNMLHMAIRMYKARNQMHPVDESVTQALIQGLGLGGRVQQPEDRPSGPGVTQPTTTQLFWPFAFTASSMFMMYTLWRYRRRR